MKRHVLMIVSLAILVSCLQPIALSAATPTLTWDIAVSGGMKTYTYTLLNDAGLGPITDLSIYMPVAGSNSIASFACSNSSFQAYVYSGIAEVGSWDGLGDGQSMQIWLQTPADVLTIYDYEYSSGPPQGNWFWTNDGDTPPGGTSIPVPGPSVPEPSSILTLACGLVGVGGLMRRRQKK